MLFAGIRNLRLPILLERQVMDSTKDRNGCSFQSIVLSMVKHRLNLMLSEVCQLKEDEADFSSDERLTRQVLEKIAEEKITSVHIRADEAQSFLDILEEMYSHSESYNPLDENSERKAEEDTPSLFPKKT